MAASTGKGGRKPPEKPQGRDRPESEGADDPGAARPERADAPQGSRPLDRGFGRGDPEDDRSEGEALADPAVPGSDDGLAPVSSAPPDPERARPLEEDVAPRPADAPPETASAEPGLDQPAAVVRPGHRNDEPLAAGPSPDGIDDQRPFDDTSLASDRPGDPGAPGGPENVTAASVPPADLASDEPGGVDPLAGPAEAPRTARSGPGFVPLFVGGACAALLGAFAVLLLFPTGFGDPGEVPEDDRVRANSAELAAQAAVITALREDLNQLAELVAGVESGGSGDDLLAFEQSLQQGFNEIGSSVEGIAGRIDNVEERLASIGDRVGALQSRVESVENAEAPQQENLSEDLRQQIETLRSDLQGSTDQAEERLQQIVSQAEEAQQRLEDAQAQAEDVQASAAEAADTAIAESALARIEAAMGSGEPYQIAISELSEVTEASVPDALAGPAEEGVPTLGNLQETFPEAARTALRAQTRAETEGEPLDRVGALLRVRTGQRSLAPKEGDDADAVLSRAEAALREGELERALSELEALGEAGRQEMQDWIGRAETRLAAVQAVQSLDEQVTPE